MIAYRSALSLLEEVAATRLLPCEDVPFREAMGRVLAEAIRSPEEVPSFTGSAMDGFAVFAADTDDASSSSPVLIPVRGLVTAGDARAFQAASAEGRGSAIEIMTGAPLPTGGHDAVIRVEDVSVERTPDGEARSILVSRPVSAGNDVRPRGTDYAIGQPVLAAGTLVGAEHAMASASLGIAKLPLRRRPRIAVLSTGNELVPAESGSLPPGMIRNSTGPFLVASLRALGAEVRDLGIATDDPARARRMLERALEEGAEVVLSTGAVSMGKHDFVPAILKEMGARTHFHKAAIRPGKPILFAELGKEAVFFGLPGNPVSTAVGARFFVEPYLRAILGLPREEPLRARLAEGCRKPEGFRSFLKGTAVAGAGGVEVRALKGQASYVVHSLLEASCWLVLPEEKAEVAAGQDVEIHPLSHAFANPFQRGVRAP